LKVEGCLAAETLLRLSKRLEKNKVN